MSLETNKRTNQSIFIHSKILKTFIIVLQPINVDLVIAEDEVVVKIENGKVKGMCRD
jgi:hypothetical protein